MQLIPAIDLRAGQVVRLAQGDFSRETRFKADPVMLAWRYQEAGARCLHVVDLDSAREGGHANLEAIEAICATLSIPVQTGGGVRSLDDLMRRLDCGASRVVVGSLCVKEPHLVAGWIEEVGAERIVAGLDVTRNFSAGWVPKAAGWTEEGELDLFALLDILREAGLVHLLCTDIERDGMLTGPSLGLYRQLTERHAGLKVQASGGVGKAEHLEKVAETGVAACIVGRALLEGKLSLTEIERWSR